MDARASSEPGRTVAGRPEQASSARGRRRSLFAALGGIDAGGLPGGRGIAVELQPSSVAGLERRGLRTRRAWRPARAMRGLPRAWRAAVRRQRAHPLGADARLTGRYDLGPGSGWRPARRAVSGAFPRVRSASGRECSPRPGRPTGSLQCRGAAWVSWSSRAGSHDNHWKISVVQSPPWRCTSWARAGPSGRAWKSTKKSRSTSIPPSGWQFTFRSQERSSG
jgi:hypothetical protein